jgi:hypothetical protein
MEGRQFVKMILLPLGLIFLFGGGFVAVTKPFNARSTVFVVGLGIALLLCAMSSGLPKWVGIAMLLTLLAVMILVRRRR